MFLFPHGSLSFWDVGRFLGDTRFEETGRASQEKQKVTVSFLSTLLDPHQYFEGSDKLSRDGDSRSSESTILGPQDKKRHQGTSTPGRFHLIRQYGRVHSLVPPSPSNLSLLLSNYTDVSVQTLTTSVFGDVLSDLGGL